MRKSTKQKKALQSQYVLDQYKKAHGEDALNPSSVTDWAIERGIWKAPPVDPARQLRQDLVRTLRAQTVADSKGRDVRRNHPVVMTDGKRRFSVWADITTATPKHMQLSLQQGRTGIRDYCRQHKLAFDFFNENNAYGAALKPFEYDFRADLDEMDFPTDYPDEKPQ